jgi:hypothetical protein
VDLTDQVPLSPHHNTRVSSAALVSGQGSSEQSTLVEEHAIDVGCLAEGQSSEPGDRGGAIVESNLDAPFSEWLLVLSLARVLNRESHPGAAFEPLLMRVFVL